MMILFSRRSLVPSCARVQLASYIDIQESLWCCRRTRIRESNFVPVQARMRASQSTVIYGRVSNHWCNSLQMYNVTECELSASCKYVEDVIEYDYTTSHGGPLQACSTWRLELDRTTALNHSHIALTLYNF